MLISPKVDWLGNIRADILAGTVVALALIPEAIAFSVMAGVDPKVGLYASFCIAVITAIAGGRPGMISAATGAMAVLMADFVKDYGAELGLQYLLVATLLTGVIQIILGVLRVDRFMSFVSRSVITGFVNALAIIIFMAQLPEVTGDNFSLDIYLFVAAGLGIIYLFPLIPKIGKLLPSPLVCIITLSVVAVSLNVSIPTVSDRGELPDQLPYFLLPSVPWTLETLWIILPTSMALAIVGLLESLMTANIVDELTDTKSDKGRECKAQGIANIGAGLLGGMAGCAMIGQSVINVKSGGRGRLSSLVAGVFLMCLVVFLDEWLSVIPMAALVAVMFMVCIGTFDWRSILKLKEHPFSTNIVMLATVITVVGTHNLAWGVFAGVLLASLFFANKISHFMYVLSEPTDQGRRYEVHGQVFFNSAERFINAFDFKEVVSKIEIDLSHAHFWDITAVSALDKVVIKYRREGAEVEVIGLNKASETIVDRFGVHDKPEEIDKVMGGH